MEAGGLEPREPPHLSNTILVIRRILYPTDFSMASGRALEIAIAVARQNDADLILAHVLPPAVPLYEIESAMRPAAESALAALVKKVAVQGVNGKRVLIKGAAPVSQAIVECANFFGVDLIIMGTHGRSGIASWLKGSVASQVIAKTRRPTLMVPI